MPGCHVATTREGCVASGTGGRAEVVNNGRQAHARNATKAIGRRHSLLCGGHEDHGRLQGGVNRSAAADAAVRGQVLQLVASDVKQDIT
eukprot:920160-Pleurochrysis_carterae.AAC.1